MCEVQNVWQKYYICCATKNDTAYHRIYLFTVSLFVCVNEINGRNQRSTRLIWHTAITIDSCIYFMRNKRLLKDSRFLLLGLKWTLFILTIIMIIALFTLHFNVSSLQTKLQMYIIHLSTLTAVPRTVTCIIKNQNCFVINWMLAKSSCYLHCHHHQHNSNHYPHIYK